MYNHLNLPDSIRVLGKETIKYVYDATGNKLAKKTVDSTSGVKRTTTTYIGGFVYQNDSLQFMAQEEGRIREKSAGGKDTMYYDYFIKDHLGNVRMVLTDEMKNDVYLATMEEDNDAFENLLFLNRESIVDKPSCFDEDEGNRKVQKLTAAAEDDNNGIHLSVVGVSKLIKVMAGDKFKAQVFGWFDENETGNDADVVSPIENVLAQLLAGGIINVGGKGNISSITSSTVLPAVNSFIGGQENYSESQSAYLNWILLDDEQLNYIDGGMVSLFDLAEGDCHGKALLQTNEGDAIEIPRNGYLLVYVSNTSRVHPVYFDDFFLLRRVCLPALA